MGDIIESQAIEAVYGLGPHVTGLKSYTGHTMGTCGVIELIMTLYMMAEGFLAPTLNLEEVDPRCGMVRHTPGVIAATTILAAFQILAFGGDTT
jgi:3-oxoacyl-[acyl-carrier-protein] synthase II